MFVTMVSIRQNAYPDLLPDFRNLGVMARVLLAVNGAALVGSLYPTPELPRALGSPFETPLPMPALSTTPREPFVPPVPLP